MEKNKIGKRLGVGWGINVIGNKRHGTRETVKSESNWIFFLFLPHLLDRARGNRHAIKNLSICLTFPCYAAIQSISADDCKDQNLSLLPRGRLLLKNFMIIYFFAILYFRNNCNAYLSSTFAEPVLSRTFLKKIPLQIADRLNVPTRPKARELLPLSCQNWVLLIVRYAQLFK